MQVKFQSPYQAQVDIVDIGRVVKNGDVITVSEAQGAELIKNPHFRRCVPPPQPAPAPAAVNVPGGEKHEPIPAKPAA
jgi:hypothetical protein